jgi:hypothetical protein
VFRVEASSRFIQQVTINPAEDSALTFKSVCRWKALPEAGGHASKCGVTRRKTFGRMCLVAQSAEIEPVMLSHERNLSRDRARAGKGARSAIVTSVRTSITAIFPLLVACTAPGKPNPEYPRSEAVCQYVGLDSVETQQRADMDSLSFVATYRFRDSHTPATETPVGVKFQVNRSRVDELRSHLASQPEVVCAPDHDAHYQVRVKPLPEPGSSVPAPPPSESNAPLPGPGQPPPSGPIIR